jgi:hypothetical protein
MTATNPQAPPPPVSEYLPWVPPPALPPRRPPVPTRPNVHELANDRYFRTSDELGPVPVPAPPPPARPARNPEEDLLPPPPKYEYRQPREAPRVFEFTPGPVRDDVADRLGLDEDSQGSLGTSVQLLAVGPQNYVLDINPQMSFFKAVYHRHTAFATECFDDAVTLALGGTTVVPVPRRGDMLGSVTLEIRLPDLGVAGGAWADAIGYVLMSRVRLVIDDTTIHDHERLWYDLVDRVYTPHGRRQAIDAMIGRGRRLPTDRAHTVYLPFKFFCCKGQYASQQFLPLASLNAVRTRLTLEFTAETLDGCVVLPAGARPPPVASLQAKLLTEQAFVEQDERRAAMLRPSRIMVETAQDVDVLSYQFDDNGTYDVQTATLDLGEVNLPVKALAFVAYDEGATRQGRYFEYLDCVDSAVLMIGSAERFARRGGDYFSLVQTYSHAVRCSADHVHLYSFALSADSRQPSGALNFAVLDRPTLRVQLKNSEGRAVKVKAFAHCVNWLAVDSGAMAFVFQG